MYLLQDSILILFDTCGGGRVWILCAIVFIVRTWEKNARLKTTSLDEGADLRSIRSTENMDLLEIRFFMGHFLSSFPNVFYRSVPIKEAMVQIILLTFAVICLGFTISSSKKQKKWLMFVEFLPMKSS